MCINLDMNKYPQLRHRHPLIPGNPTTRQACLLTPSGSHPPHSALCPVLRAVYVVCGWCRGGGVLYYIYIYIYICLYLSIYASPTFIR